MEMMNGGAKVLPEAFEAAAVVAEPLPEVVELNGGGVGVGKVGKGKREIVLGRNVHTTCLAIEEPEANDDFTGDKEAYMAGVLARYRKTLMERTKHHLGTLSLAFSDLPLLLGYVPTCFCLGLRWTSNVR